MPWGKEKKRLEIIQRRTKRDRRREEDKERTKRDMDKDKQTKIDGQTDKELPWRRWSRPMRTCVVATSPFRVAARDKSDPD